MRTGAPFEIQSEAHLFSDDWLDTSIAVTKFFWNLKRCETSIPLDKLTNTCNILHSDARTTRMSLICNTFTALPEYVAWNLHFWPWKGIFPELGVQSAINFGWFHAFTDEEFYNYVLLNRDGHTLLTHRENY